MGGTAVYANNAPPQRAVDMVDSALVKMVASSVTKDWLQTVMDSQRRRYLRIDSRFSDERPKSIHIDNTISINPM
jgi:hypothetical protein